MTVKRFTIENNNGEVCIKDNLTKKYPFAYVCEEIDMQDSMISECMECSNLLNQLWEQTQRFEKYSQEHLEERNALHEENKELKKENAQLDILIKNNHLAYIDLEKENEQLKAQLYCDDEEGVCNTCKHHYLVKDDEVELGYYNSRCRKGHYECARVSLKYCEDFEKELR